jgi:hypothetical protein
MYEGRATKQMLQKLWRKDAEYEVRKRHKRVKIRRGFHACVFDLGRPQDPFTKCKGLHEIAPQVNCLDCLLPTGALLLTLIYSGMLWYANEHDPNTTLSYARY